MIIAGNWKMNLDKGEAESLASGILSGLPKTDNEIIFSPSFIHLENIARIIENSEIKLSGQDCAIAEKGAYTGEVSADMLESYGCDYVILGHSERRSIYNETSDDVSKKARIAKDNNLKSIICIGETLAEKEAGKTKDVLQRQIAESIPEGFTEADFIIAYEPVWAIGTGLVPEVEDIREIHAYIKEQTKILGDIKILYGGSANDKNCDELTSIDNVDGLLVGGASLNVERFLKICGVMSS